MQIDNEIRNVDKNVSDTIIHVDIVYVMYVFGTGYTFTLLPDCHPPV